MMKKTIKLYVLFVIGLFSVPSYAEIDVVVLGGMKQFNGTTVNMPSETGPKTDWENHAWIFDTDVFYRLPAGFSIGLRYQHLLSSGLYTKITETESSSDASSSPETSEAEESNPLQTFHSNAGRIALIGGYKFINGLGAKGFFAGVLVAIDVFKFFIFDMNKTEEAFSVDKTITDYSWSWEKLTGQVGFEVGFKWTHLFLKAEIGYDLFSFNNLSCGSQTDQCATHSPEDAFNFNSFYGMLGIGYAFK